MIDKFYYKIGPIETTTLWMSPVPISKVNSWWEDFKQLDLEDYNVYLGGKYVIDPKNTTDIDICLTGPIYDYMKLYNLLKTGMDLGLNKHNILIDIKHYDNINFFKYPRNKDFHRYHIATELAGEIVKKINGKLKTKREIKTYIPYSKVPKQLAVNLVEFPLDKQIEDGRIYDPVKLN